MFIVEDKFPHADRSDFGESSVVKLLICDHEHWCRDVIVTGEHVSVTENTRDLPLLVDITTFGIFVCFSISTLQLLVVSRPATHTYSSNLDCVLDEAQLLVCVNSK